MKFVFAFIDNQERALFFRELESLATDTKFVYLTNRPLLELLYGFQLIKPHRGCSALKELKNPQLLKDCIDWRMNRINLKQLGELRAAIGHVLDENLKKIDSLDKLVFAIWNGHRSHDICIRDLSFERGIKTVFLEQPNIDGKLIVDGRGIGPNSEFFEKFGGRTKRAFSNIDQWGHEYLSRRYQKPIGQIRNTSFVKKWERIINWLLNLFRKSPQSSFYPVLGKILNRLPIGKRSEKGVELNLDSLGKFIFVPLQLEGDSQIVLHHDGSRLSVLQEAFRQSSLLQLPVVVKIHPADKKPFLMREIGRKGSISSNELYISSNSTYELIKKSELIVTVNSTVGFEALLINKKVIYVGKSLFANMSTDDLWSYINEYLVSHDYFDQRNIGDITEILFERASHNV